MAIPAGGIGAVFQSDAERGGRRAAVILPQIVGGQLPSPIVDYSSFTTPCPAGLSGAGRIRLPGDCSNVETN
ncbi:MAG: hypothetical protein FD175_1226 [Beijerinckiaceae bacterium]|nr:MAG: hypothetical protein FD175_1226 [Beijerinckiaceae bacterium]